MTEYIEGALSPRDKLNSEYLQRSKIVIYETVSAKNKKALADIVSGKEKEGWTVFKKNKKSTRLQTPKEEGKQFEDDMWCILYRMGFTRLNKGLLKIKVRPDEFRQMDVLAVDNESGVFVECTQSKEPRKKSMTPLIEKIVACRQGAGRSLRSYCEHKKLKIGWVIATRNIIWSRPDLKRASEENIIPIRDSDFDYFTQLVEHLRLAARYQFLAYLFRGQRIAEMALQVPATKAEMGGKTFYSFVVSPRDLLKRAFVAHKAQESGAGIEYYQRLISKARLRKIADFVDSGGLFPTNIVVNFHDVRSLVFEEREKIHGVSVGRLHLPSQYACAWVIDGQHRLFGYAHSKRATKKDDKMAFPVLAFHGLSSSEEAWMFVKVNHEQKSVSTSLLYEIYATLNWESADFKLRTEALASRLALALNNEATSPLHGRVMVQGQKGSDLRCLTVQNLSEPLKKKGFFGEERRNGQVIPGPLSDSNSSSQKETFEKAYEALSELFGYVSEQATDHWQLGKKPGGFLAMNMGVRSMLGVFREVLQYVQRKEGISLDRYNPDTFMPAVKELFEPVVTHFRTATEEETRRFRDHVGMAGLRRCELEMMRLIKGAIPDFTAEGLDEYIAALDIEGTKEARDLIFNINRTLHEYVIARLKEKFGDNDAEAWWWQGIPMGVRKGCDDRRNEDMEPRPASAYFNLIDYHTIAEANWNLFGEPFTLFKGDEQKIKKERLKWIVHLNQMRKSTVHAERGYLTKEEVKKVRAIYAAVMEKLGG